MNEHARPETRKPLLLERRYEADVEDLWALWTTREGFESWWGPEGFRVEVSAIEARSGGALVYEMIAAGAEQIAFMKSAGMPLSHPVRATFVEVDKPKRLRIRAMIDFVPGVAPYPNDVLVELFAEGQQVRMRLTIDPHHDPIWTQRAEAGWTSQLTKLPAALARRRG